MKKIIILFLNVLITIGAMAQKVDIKEMKKYTLECLYGRTTLINYPTISMFRKDIPSYSDMNVYINILYNTKENFSWELFANVSVFQIFYIILFISLGLAIFKLGTKKVNMNHSQRACVAY